MMTPPASYCPHGVAPQRGYNGHEFCSLCKEEMQFAVYPGERSTEPKCICTGIEKDSWISEGKVPQYNWKCKKHFPNGATSRQVPTQIVNPAKPA